MHIFVCFLVRALNEVRDPIRKQFCDKVLYNYCSKFFFLRFVLKNDVPKNGFLIVFSKSDFGGGGTVFSPFFVVVEKANHPRICLSFGGNVGET